MKKWFACWLSLAAGTVLVAGCGSHDASAAKDSAPAAAAPAEDVPQAPDSVNADASVRADAAPAAKTVGLESVTCAQWDETLATHRGKIVVVDTWATWCIPCREEFPKLVELHRELEFQGLVCMSVSVDEPEAKEEAAAFLKEHNASFANYLIEDEPDAWWDKWNIKGIPVVLVFDRDGKLSKKFDKDDPDNQFTYADVEKHVKELLAAK